MLPAGDDWTECFTVHGISLPTAPFIGISAMTGDVSDNHDIVAVTTYSALLSSPDAPRDQFRTNKPTDAETSFLPTFVKFVLFCGVVAGLLYGYKNYALRQAGKDFASGFGFGQKAPALGSPFYDSKRF